MGGGDGDHGRGACGGEEITTIHGALLTMGLLSHDFR
jgi:hypothetical protein